MLHLKKANTGLWSDQYALVYTTKSDETKAAYLTKNHRGNQLGTIFMLVAAALVIKHKYLPTTMPAQENTEDDQVEDSNEETTED